MIMNNRRKKKERFIKKMIRKMRRKAKLEMLDEMARITGAISWMLFSPSFYFTHTQEEIEQAEAEQLAECERLLEELE